MLLEYETVHYSKAIILHRHQLIIKTLYTAHKFPLGYDFILPDFFPRWFDSLHLSGCYYIFYVVRGTRANTINHLTPFLRFFFASLSIRVINAGKSMLNEDQASCEKLFVKKPSGKNRNSTLLEDNGVSEGQGHNYQSRGQ